MSVPLFLTGKYLKSKKDSRFLSVISIITIIGISLGVAVVIIALTILDGFESVVSEKIMNFNSHIKVTGFSSRNLEEPSLVIPQMKDKLGNNFTSIQPFISKLVIIKAKKYTEGITLTSIDNVKDNSELKNFIQEGSFNIEPDSGLPKIILGKKLTDKMFIKPGDRVTIFSLRNDNIPTSDNPPAIQQFIVSGIYESGLSEYDDLNGFINFAAARDLFGMMNEISGYNIRIKDISQVKILAEQLQDFLGYPYYVRTIFQIHQNIFTWIDLQKKPIPIVLGLIIFVAVFNIVGTLLMIILERTNAVGILRSLGAGRKLIIKTFLYHAVYLISIGIIIGNFLALVLSIIQKEYNIISLPGKIYFINKVPISIELSNYLLVTIVTLIVSLAASLLPAWIASKIKPISAIRFD
jgi:lipoprotein-releasing system permease protein